MVQIGIFQTVSQAYRSGATELWRWQRSGWWWLKLPMLIWVCPSSLALYAIGLVTMSGWIFDKLAQLVDAIRNKTVSVVEKLSYTTRQGYINYAASPFILIPITPLVFAAGFIPKIGLSHIVHHEVHFDHPDSRYFGRVSRTYFNFASDSWTGLWRNQIVLFPIKLLAAIILIPWSIAFGIFFTTLRTLDFISMVISYFRNGIVSSIGRLGNSASNDIINVIFCPILLLVMYPLFIAALLVPKISTSDHHA